MGGDEDRETHVRFNGTPTSKNTINPLELFVEKRQFFNQNNQ